MSQLQARIRIDGDIYVVQFSGRIDVESAVPFRAACKQTLAQKKVVFDFRDLNFIGSQGMLAFLEALRDYTRENPGQVKFAGIGIELQRVLSATSLVQIEAYDAADGAILAFKRPPMPMMPVQFHVAVAGDQVVSQDSASTSDLLNSRCHAEEAKDSRKDEDYESEYGAEM